MDHKKLNRELMNILQELAMDTKSEPGFYYQGALWALSRCAEFIEEDLEGDEETEVTKLYFGPEVVAEWETPVEIKTSETEPKQSPEVLKDVLPAKHPAPKKKRGRPSLISDEEIKDLFDMELSTKQIADRTGMSMSTVNRRLLAIKAKEAKDGSH